MNHGSDEGYPPGPIHSRTSVHGVVTDAETGLPLADATVRIEGEPYASITDDLGTFVLETGVLSSCAERYRFRPGHNQWSDRVFFRPGLGACAVEMH